MHMLISRHIDPKRWCRLFTDVRNKRTSLWLRAYRPHLDVAK